MADQNAVPARILGIETSCDETAAAVVESGRTILSNVVASQIDLHAQYGGVFPEVASRQHVRTVYSVVDEALQKAHISLKDVDAIAVTRGPGLAGSLVVGVNAAKAMALSADLPIMGVNHLEGHIYSAWLQNGAENRDTPQFPLVALLVSGGHTEIVLVEEHLKYVRLGKTLDDAAGEAFDKVARLLDLTYPGGPAIQEAAQNGNPDAFAFPKAKVDHKYDFSFSGLKTAVMREVKSIQAGRKPIPVPDLAASFQKAVVEVLFSKTVQAAKEHHAKSIVVAGGVSANQALRDTFAEYKDIPVYIPSIGFSTDNAAMISAAGYFRFLQNRVDSLEFDVEPNWPIH